jgi:hypothetical protein
MGKTTRKLSKPDRVANFFTDLKNMSFRRDFLRFFLQKQVLNLRNVIERYISSKTSVLNIFCRAEDAIIVHRL